MPPKKKKKKPRSRARGAAAGPATPQAEQAAPSQEKRRERLEARREAKAKAMVQRRRQQQRARVIRTVVLVGSLAVIIWFLFLRTSIPDAIAGNDIEHFDTFATESRANTLHTSDPISFASTPPVSGEHSLTPADCGVYAQAIPDENMVHSLEHGAVGILYQPDVPIEEIRNVEEMVQEFDSHVFSAPYPELEDPYTVVAWAHLMRLDSLDLDAVEEFVNVFREGGDAPEEQDCPMGANQPFQPNPSATVTPGATPGADETPAPEETEGSGDKGDGDKSDGDKKKKKNKD